MHPYSNWLINSIVIAATIFAVSLCVMIHFEGLQLAARKVPKLGLSNRSRLIYIIHGILLWHVVEIWIFGLTGWFLLNFEDAGSISGQSHIHLFDMIYLSAMTFSTVGYGDITPNGPLRFLLGAEALTGLVMITWSASFTFLEMQNLWGKNRKS